MKSGYLFVAALLSLAFVACQSALTTPDEEPSQPPAVVAGQPTETATQPSPTESIAPTGTPSPTILPSPTSTVFIYAYGPNDFPEEINPLTGLAVEDPGLLNRRPIVIKVTNFPRSVRPQSGLSRADHVYEYYIADNFSRFVGVFYGRDASQVGPIRSARLFDAHVTRMYSGIFVFGWADDPILNFLFAPDLKPHLIVERPDNCPPLCREPSKKDKINNLFIDTTYIADYLKKRRTNNDRQDVSGLRFEAAVPSSGNPAGQIFIDFSLVSFHHWDYDGDAGRYLRFQEAGGNTGDELEYAPLVDALTQEQLSADNVIVIFTPHQFFKKSSSTEIIDQPFMGEGLGYAFRDGRIYPLSWAREEADQLPELRLPDGSLYPLKPGITWWEILGETSQIEQINETWHFTFATP
jgi:hypothetical protein